MSMQHQTGNSSKFIALWRRALTLPNLDELSPKLVDAWAMQHGTAVTQVGEAEVGSFVKTPAIRLELDGGDCGYLPKVPAEQHPAWDARRASCEQRAKLWRKVEWFEPLWVPQARVEALLQDVRSCDHERALELFNYHASTIYTVPFQAVCVAQLIPQCRSLQEFVPLVRESFLAFYSGYRASSIAALIPLVESAVSRIAKEAGGGQDLTTVDAVEKAVASAIDKATSIYFEGSWAPREYRTMSYLLALDERIYVFETFRRWLRTSFFERTGEYSGTTWLNRHLFAHGMSASWQQAPNFIRLIVALTTLGVIERWGTDSSGASLFFPEMDGDARLLWQEALFRAKAQGILNRLAEERYHAHGRLVPEMPTDDGTTLRRAILADDCINDLVRPLRDAGWSVEVDDPDESGLYITLCAKSASSCFGLALLYSCATANQIYRALANEADIILYRGAPYHQDQYAYGIDAHVGPVTGWQPPAAPGLGARR
ncbi:MAG TPA: hypothetical protein RMH85_33410 [Polyangiaceae bacterium LLY-WYZ-15_(1-7)]|nr:hypothetical protein [Polyangiaceae bacterium LLY-WYZ-15_(1-7)]HJL13429.1 hypothetical protein [Polyangiaceae bacterium LLY-WYZ-15_(1-7)]HJL26433.1 hypothetical protein [Polyangiaceae bacterium LLY-WYZ-15_(1-7)]HJL32637.1 hypothetical protein [Polyangiaceae bacterium LLY-WYZ-15_(1-7)]HJL39501.1 hypothetical protein [Polyangiaceae bacterium LLY-WYZ-15_(1-7)]